MRRFFPPLPFNWTIPATLNTVHDSFLIATDAGNNVATTCDPFARLAGMMLDTPPPGTQVASVYAWLDGRDLRIPALIGNSVISVSVDWDAVLTSTYLIENFSNIAAQPTIEAVPAGVLINFRGAGGPSSTQSIEYQQWTLLGTITQTVVRTLSASNANSLWDDDDAIVVQAEPVRFLGSGAQVGGDSNHLTDFNIFTNPQSTFGPFTAYTTLVPCGCTLPQSITWSTSIGSWSFRQYAYLDGRCSITIQTQS